MDIHKPKPWHGPRELLKEIGVIVIGVLIALAGEQAVEWLHRQAEVREAREALRSEIAANAGLARYNSEEERCREVALDRYDAWADGGQPPVVSARRGTFPTFATSVWETVKVGAASHMPLQERLAYSRFYDLVSSANANVQDVRGAFLQLIPYRTKPALQPSDALGLKGLVAQARTLGGNRRLFNERLLEQTNELGVKPAPLSALQRQALVETCRPYGVTPNLPM